MSDRSDYGTRELSERKRTKVERGGIHGRHLRVRVVDEDEIDRMLLLGIVDVEQYHVLERFRGDLLRGGWLSPRAQNLEPRVSGIDSQEFGEKTAFARARINRAITWLDNHVGNKVRVLIISICLDETSVTSQDTENIHDGIDALSSFYE